MLVVRYVDLILGSRGRDFAFVWVDQTVFVRFSRVWSNANRGVYSKRVMVFVESHARRSAKRDVQVVLCDFLVRKLWFTVH